MPLIPGTYPLGGPVIPTAAARLPATPELRDAGVVDFFGGVPHKVNEAGDDWEPIDAEVKADVAAHERQLDALATGALGFPWYYAIKQTQDFIGTDFTRPGTSASSDFPELNIPEVDAEQTWFGAIAIPIDAPLAHVNKGAFIAQDQLGSSRYYRQLAPVTIRHPDGIVRACRLWIGRFWHTERDGGDELTLVPRLRLANYYRQARVHETTAINDLGWVKSRTPLLQLDDFGGIDQHVAVSVPAAAPHPTWISVGRYGRGANAIGQFSEWPGPLVIDGVEQIILLSDAPLPAADWSGQKLIVLPERANISYFSPPTVLDQSDLGFTWYAGFYSYALNPLDHPENPVTAAVIQGAEHVVNGRTPQLTLPGGPWMNREYIPNRAESSTKRYVRFIAQPRAQADVTGVTDIRLPFLSYQSVADIESGAETNLQNNWRLQTDRPMVNGVEFEVWLNRRSTSVHNTAFGGATIYTFRSI